VASTADSLVFENGFEFGATNPEAPPLLTINVPVGLQYGETAERIRVRGDGFQDFFTGLGLRVQPEKTLALVGGEVNLEGGVLFAPNGRGGIPTSPTEPLSSNDVVSEWVTLDAEEETTEDTETPTHSISTPKQIVEAQGWIVNERGQVVLVANAPTVSPQTPRQTAPSCEDTRANAPE
jgi:large exoprotein involved in heme utilization and adhesion